MASPVAKSLLLHVCCGPCAIMPAFRLRAEGFNIVAWFMNPNIQPLAEYLRRRETAGQCASHLGIDIIYEDSAWNLARWLEVQLPAANSPQRCEWCCGMRLEAAYEKAAELNMSFFSSSLLYSRYQPHDFIARKGRELSDSGGPEFIYRDFRTDWQQGIDLSIEWQLYRQPYCGCIFSENERYAKKLARMSQPPKK